MIRVYYRTKNNDRYDDTFGVQPADYDAMIVVPLQSPSPAKQVCEEVWALMNQDERPGGQDFRSMCKGDIVELDGTAWLCKVMGFHALPAESHFLDDLHKIFGLVPLPWRLDVDNSNENQVFVDVDDVSIVLERRLDGGVETNVYPKIPMDIPIGKMVITQADINAAYGRPVSASLFEGFDETSEEIPPAESR